jgi:hypothetical protein
MSTKYEVWVKGKRRCLTEALVADVQVPEVDPQVIRGDVGLLIRVDGDRVYMVCMSIGVHLPRDGSYDVVLVGHTREAKMLRRGRLGEIRLGHGPDLLLINLP